MQGGGMRRSGGKGQFLLRRGGGQGDIMGKSKESYDENVCPQIHRQGRNGGCCDG